MHRQISCFIRLDLAETSGDKELATKRQLLKNFVLYPVAFENKRKTEGLLK
ncbi:MAG: hypothetical protein ACYCVH_06250 [Ignavibacteriaceae bacterium]